MSNPLHLTNAEFPFANLSLANPQGLQGGAYFSKIRMNNEPVIIQTPKCLTKNGIHKTEKKIYCDIMLNQDNEEFINWAHQLEVTIKDLIFKKRDLWFHNDMDYDSIEYHWQPLLRTYKGNKSLLRCFIAKQKGLYKKEMLQIYDEEENKLSLDDVTKTSKFISILEISGLKFTQQSFNIQFLIKQIMIIKEKPLFDKCLIQYNTASITKTTNNDSDAASDISVDDIEQPVEKTTEQPTEKADENKNLDTSGALTEEMIVGSDIPPTEPSLKNNIVELINEDGQSFSDKPLSKNIEKTSNEHSKNNDITTVSENLNHDKVVDSKKIKESLEETITLNESLEKNGIISEIELLLPSSEDIVVLKKPNEVYMEIYKEARLKAKTAKKIAVQAYLEAKRIKSLYLLDTIESSDDEDIEHYLE